MSASPLHPGEKLARAALRRYGLPPGRPPRDLLDAVETSAGVPVLIDRFADSEIAGVLLRHADGESFIAINADLIPVRQRFTLAHEWGHIEAGHTPRVELATELFGSPARDPQEIEANYFAAELLAPRQALEEWLAVNQAGEEPEAPDVARMAMAFGISFPTACYRLERAGVIARARKETLLAELRATGRAHARRFEADQVKDALEELAAQDAYPHAPRVTGDYATQALAANLLDQAEYEEIIGTSDRLDAWLT